MKEDNRTEKSGSRTEEPQPNQKLKLSWTVEREHLEMYFMFVILLKTVKDVLLKGVPTFKKYIKFVPDFKFIPKTEAVHAPKVSPSIHISMNRDIRMIRFL